MNSALISSTQKKNSICSVVGTAVRLGCGDLSNRPKRNAKSRPIDESK